MSDQSKSKDAIVCFNSGFNCAQAIVSTYCEQFGMDKETALKASCGLGGGFGKLQETCGAVTGAYLIIGLKHGQYLSGDSAAKEKTYALVREFERQFKDKHSTTNCRELLGADLKQMPMEQVKRKCSRIVREAAQTLENVLRNEEAAP